MSSASSDLSDAAVIAATRGWLERAVIGLSLCPFARSVHVKEQICYVVSAAESPEALRADLVRELRALAAADPHAVDTTLLIHPKALRDFLDFNDFLKRANQALIDLGLEGELQIASFHPDYYFADSEPEDAANNRSRSPYPTLHLLREASVSRAVEAFPEAGSIYLKNIETLRALGKEGWLRLMSEPDRA